MKRVLYGLYALLSYAIGMASLLYIAAFVWVAFSLSASTLYVILRVKTRH